MNNVHAIMNAAQTNPYIVYTPAPIVGGYIQNINVILNYDNLSHYNIPEEKVFDFLYITLGKYRDDYTKSVIRTYNPLFWIGCILDYIISLPFFLLGWIGVNKEKIEYSFLGRFIKGICKLIVVIGVIFGILEHLGYMEPVKNFVNKQVDTYILRAEPQLENQEQAEEAEEVPEKR